MVLHYSVQTNGDVNCLNSQMAIFTIMMHCVSLHIKCCNMVNMAANKRAYHRFKYTYT